MVARVCLLALALFGTAHARGVSPYLPLNLHPEIERKIERLLILADQPVLTRPIAAATVLDALPRACERDAVLCAEVRRYLTSLTRTAGINYASLSVGAHSGAATALPNRHGMDTNSYYEANAAVYWQPADHFIVSGGFVAYEGESTPTGSMISFGTQYLQIDLGYRDHWFSPLTDSAMLLSTEAQTMPSATISSYAPLTRFKLSYEAFIGELSESNNIIHGGVPTSGNPLLAGLHLSIEPVTGWSIGINRIMQYGGGERPDSFGDLLEAFFDPSSDNTGTETEFGNQVASLSTRYIIPGRTPVAVYFEYAGEDTSTTNNARIGNVALSAGVDLPSLMNNRLALTVEISEWQNGWYVHHIYQDGLRNHGNVIGHWGGDWRVTGDGIGARSYMVRAGYGLGIGGTIEATYRALDNENYATRAYEGAYDFELRYSRPWRQLFWGAEVNTGRDSFGESFSHVSAFIRF